MLNAGIQCIARAEFAADAQILAAARPGRRQVADAGVVGERVHGQVHGRHAVHDRMVNLGVNGETVAFQPFDQMRLPQRAMSVEQGAVQPRD